MPLKQKDTHAFFTTGGMVGYSGAMLYCLITRFCRHFTSSSCFVMKQPTDNRGRRGCLCWAGGSGWMLEVVQCGPA